MSHAARILRDMSGIHEAQANAVVQGCMSMIDGMRGMLEGLQRGVGECTFPGIAGGQL